MTFDEAERLAVQIQYLNVREFELDANVEFTKVKGKMQWVVLVSPSTQ